MFYVNFKEEKLLFLEIWQNWEDIEKTSSCFRNYAKIHGVDFLLGYGDLIRHTTSAFGNKRFFFPNKSELIDFLKKILETRDNILLKGSRSMRMEEILDLWK